MKFPALQSAPQEGVTKDFVPMSMFNKNTSSINSQPQTMISTPTSILAPNPTLSSSSISMSIGCNHWHPKELFEDTSEDISTRDHNIVPLFHTRHHPSSQT